MPRFFAEKSDILDGEILIKGEDYKHIKNVLRMSTGEELEVCDGEGMDYYCHVQSFDEGAVVAAIDSSKPSETELPCRIYLFQALPKLDKMDTIIQKAVELGAYAVVPVKTKRCIVKVDQDKAEKKIRRWEEISKAAAKQCGRGIIPQIFMPMSFDEALNFASTLEGSIIPYEKCTEKEATKEAFDKLKTLGSVGIFIGPEGGFEESEVSKAMDMGVSPVSLGKRILRTETAGMMVISTLMFSIEFS